jgi:hypothetical protein
VQLLELEPAAPVAGELDHRGYGVGVVGRELWVEQLATL